MQPALDKIDEYNNTIVKALYPLRNTSVTELAHRLKVNLDAKNALGVLVNRMLLSNELELSDFINSQKNLLIKTIKLNKYRQLKESISLPTFKYCDFIDETWATSAIHRYLRDNVFIFVVFQLNEKELYFNKTVVWKMPQEILDNSVRIVWENMQNIIYKGQIVKYINSSGNMVSYFPKSSSNPYVHVRPHAQNKLDTYPLPVADKLTELEKYPKHSFWLNRTYIEKIITKDDGNEANE